MVACLPRRPVSLAAGGTCMSGTCMSGTCMSGLHKKGHMTTGHSCFSVRNSCASTICPVVIRPYLCASENAQSLKITSSSRSGPWWMTVIESSWLCGGGSSQISTCDDHDEVVKEVAHLIMWRRAKYRFIDFTIEGATTDAVRYLTHCHAARDRWIDRCIDRYIDR